jgi:hypothetical protein
MPRNFPQMVVFGIVFIVLAGAGTFGLIWMIGHSN